MTPERLRQVREEVFGECLRRWPAIFDPDLPRPLKIGIHKDLQAAGISGRRVRKFLKTWVHLPAYRRALFDSLYRYDLDGWRYLRTAEDLRRDRQRQEQAA